MAGFEQYKGDLEKSKQEFARLGEVLHDKIDIGTIDGYIAEFKRLSDFTESVLGFGGGTESLVDDVESLMGTICEELGFDLNSLMQDPGLVSRSNIDEDAKALLLMVIDLKLQVNVLRRGIGLYRDELQSSAPPELGKRLQEKYDHYKRILPSFYSQAKAPPYSDVNGFLLAERRVIPLIRRAVAAKDEVDLYAKLAEFAGMVDVAAGYAVLYKEYQDLPMELVRVVAKWDLPKGFGAYMSRLVQTKPEDVDRKYDDMIGSPWSLAVMSLVSYDKDSHTPQVKIVHSKDDVVERLELIRAMIAAANSLKAMPSMGTTALVGLEGVMDTVAEADLPADLKMFRKEYKKAMDLGLRSYTISSEDPNLMSAKGIIAKLLPGRKGGF